MKFYQNESTANRRRFWVFLVSTDGQSPALTEANGQPQLSKNGNPWADTANQLVAVGNGTYYVELTQAELDTEGNVFIRYKSDNTLEFGSVASVEKNPLDQPLTGHIESGTMGGALNRIGAVSLIVQSPVTEDGNLVITRGDDYLVSNNRAIDFTINGFTYIAGTTFKFTAKYGRHLLSKDCSYLESTEDGVIIRLELPHEDTQTLKIGENLYKFEIEATRPGTVYETPVLDGKMTVKEDLTIH